jgi:hypothetical protein
MTMFNLKKFFFLCFAVVGLQAQTPPQLEQMQFYMLPEDHPLKPKLDKLFTEQHPLQDVKALRKAGFKFHLRKDRFMIVASHKELKGYLVKLYLDNHKLREGEWIQWLRRAEGAETIRSSIESHGFQELLCVPKKWIYALPAEGVAKAASNCFPKRYLLIVENMRIVAHGKNAAKYRFMMTEQLLEALFVVLKENLLIDSMYLDNIPFCKNHTVAFIDTEHFQTTSKKMPYDQMLTHLSPKMRKYWMQLRAK